MLLVEVQQSGKENYMCMTCDYHKTLVLPTPKGVKIIKYIISYFLSLKNDVSGVRIGLYSQDGLVTVEYPGLPS